MMNICEWQGHLHFYGARGVAHDPVRAARYFQAAITHHERPAAEALSSLAQMHLQGIGVVGNNDTARQYFEEAAALGHPAAFAGLGYMYLHGIGVDKDDSKALSWLKRAADAGNAEAQFNLGAMYFGKHVISNQITSNHIHRVTCMCTFTQITTASCCSCDMVNSWNRCNKAIWDCTQIF
jgi:TPR repeat protein